LSWRWLALIFAVALAARIYYAERLFLNPDEALHYLLAVQPSIAEAYKASLTTAHPPLLILFLYYWRALGHSEFILRLPQIAAGLLFCWTAFHWITRVADEETARLALPLLLFAPPLISLSGEVRQYSFLLLFISVALYCFQRAVGEDSVSWMTAFSVAIYLALLVHYSGLFLTLAIGIYAVVRWVIGRPGWRIVATWALGQAIAAGIALFLYRTHIALVKKSGLPQNIADTWLRKSIYHAGEINPVWFIIRGAIRFFHFLFGNGAIGAIALIVFLVGLTLLLSGHPRSAGCQLSPRGLGLLLVLPFLCVIAAAIVGVYPFGGTRHDVFLAPFAIVAIAVAIAAWKPRRAWVRTALVLVALLVSNVFLSPSGPFIKLRNQTRAEMRDAIATLRSSGTRAIFTDYQGGQLLSYYLCDQSAVQLSLPPYQPLTRTSCGRQTVIATSPDIWNFHADDFPVALQNAAHSYPQEALSELLTFQAGWDVDKENDLVRVFQAMGCSSPLRFGQNILVCGVNPQLNAPR